jgi:serralysin
MATTITLSDAGGDGNGVDFLSYLQEYATYFSSGYFGFFSANPADFAGNNFAIADGAATTVGAVTSDTWTVVADSGSASDLYYDFATHVLAGSLDGLSFGSGLTYDVATDSFSQASSDIDISGLGLTGTGSGNVVHNVIWGLMNSDTGALLGQLSDDDLVVNGSTGGDVIYGFAGNDVLTGNGGDDVFVFDLDATGTALAGIGTDTVSDFSVLDDVIRIGLDANYDSYAEILAAATDTAGGVTLDFGDYGSLTLAGVAVADLTTDNFAFV